MIKKNALKQLIVSMAITLLFTLNNGMAQTGNDEIKSIYLDNIVKLAVEALNDRNINIGYCEVPINPYYSEVEAAYDSDGVAKHYSVLPIPDLRSVVIRDLIRGGVNIDSLIILRDPLGDHTGSIETQYPLIYLCPRSKWLIFFDSPYLRIRDEHDYAMEKLNEYEEKLRGQVDLNTDNYFTVYENGAAFCTYFPADEKYPPMFIYSEGLVDDFRTIIKLQDNPSLLSESSDSYEIYYNSMKEELGKRVLSRLFESPNQE